MTTEDELVPAEDATPVLDTLAEITAVSLERTGLDPASIMAVRLAALAAVDASTESYLLNLGAAAEAGLTVQDVQDVLIAVAPIVGTPRILSAALRLTAAYGLALGIAEGLELEAELADAEAEAEAG